MSGRSRSTRLPGRRHATIGRQRKLQSRFQLASRKTRMAFMMYESLSRRMNLCTLGTLQRVTVGNRASPSSLASNPPTGPKKASSKDARTRRPRPSNACVTSSLPTPNPEPEKLRISPLDNTERNKSPGSAGSLENRPGRTLLGWSRGSYVRRSIAATTTRDRNIDASERASDHTVSTLNQSRAISHCITLISKS